MAKEATGILKTLRDRFESMKGEDKCKYVVAVLVSSLGAGTVIDGRDSEGFLRNCLDWQILRVLGESSLPLIRENFSFHNSWQYGGPYCKELAEFLSPAGNFGETAGLESGVLEPYKITSRTLQVAEEAREYIPKEDYEFLKELGKQLRVKRAA